MKSNNLNLGRPLSRSEMKHVKGGTAQCAIGKFVTGCLCGSSTTPVCIPANGNTPGADCILYCNGDGRVTNPATSCQASC